MRIEVKHCETKAQEISVMRAKMGAKGGRARVAKGFSMMDKEKLREMSRKAAAKRWAKV